MSTTVKRLAIALAVSIAVNLFLFGFFAARALYAPSVRHHDRPEHGHFLGPRGLSRGGDPATREVLRRAMAKRDAALRAQGDKLHATRAEVSAAFEAEPFDRQALERALAALRAQTAASQAAMHEALIEAASELTPEQRRALARRVLEREPALGRHRGKPRGP